MYQTLSLAAFPPYILAILHFLSLFIAMFLSLFSFDAILLLTKQLSVWTEVFPARSRALPCPHSTEHSTPRASKQSGLLISTIKSSGFYKFFRFWNVSSWAIVLS